MRSSRALLLIALSGVGCGSIAYDDGPTRSDEPIATSGGHAPWAYTVQTQPAPQPPALQPPALQPPALQPPAIQPPALQPPALQHGPYVTVFPAAPAPFVDLPAAPLPPVGLVRVPMESAPIELAGRVTCSGNQRLRITNEVVDGGHGPAVVASGNCVVELSESIVRGQPAVIVSGNARVELVECRIVGDLRSAGNAQIGMSGSTHRGRALRF